MAVQIKNLVELNKYIAMYLDGNESGIKFNADVLKANGEGKLFWNTEEVAMKSDIANFELPVATSSVLGGVKQGARVTVAGDGTLSANQQTWTDIIAGSTAAEVAAPSVGIFNNSSTQYQTLTQVQNLLTNLECVKTCFVVDEDYLEENPSCGYAIGDFVAIANDETELCVFNTIAEVNLSIRTGADLDPLEEDGSINQAGVYLVVNFGESNQTFTNLSAIIPTFNGNDNTYIQTTVSGGVISAILKAGSITLDRLTSTLQAKIASIDDKMNLVPLAGENKIAVFDNAGQVKAYTQTVAELITTIEDAFPVKATTITVAAESMGSVALKGVASEVKYRVTCGSNIENGNIRRNGTSLYQTDVIGDANCTFNFSGNNLQVHNNDDTYQATVHIMEFKL